MKTISLALLLSLPVTFVGCASQNPVTASTPQSVDLTMAKSLLVAQTAIEQAKTLIVTHPTFKAQLNQVIASYNIVEQSYVSYHQLLASGANPDPTMIQAQITDIMTKAQALVASIK